MGVVGVRAARRGEVYLVDLNPTRGSEIRKTRPCVIVSPDELNRHMSAYIVAPLTSGAHPYPFRIQCRFRGKAGYVVLDQIRAVDAGRLVRRMGRLTPSLQMKALSILQQMFAP